MFEIINIYLKQNLSEDSFHTWHYQLLIRSWFFFYAKFYKTLQQQLKINQGASAVPLVMDLGHIDDILVLCMEGFVGIGLRGCPIKLHNFS